MPERDFYEAWKRQRAEARVPDDFADRVMASLQLHEQRPARQLLWLYRVVFDSRAFRVSVCSLAFAAGLLRVLQVIVVFLAEHPSR